MQMVGLYRALYGDKLVRQIDINFHIVHLMPTFSIHRELISALPTLPIPEFERAGPKVVGDTKIGEDELRFAHVAIPMTSAEAEPVSDRGEA